MMDFTKRSTQEWMGQLIDLHDQLKSHPFRQQFTDTVHLGAWRSMFKKYRNLIYKTTEVLCGFAYQCTDDAIITKDDCFWVHDFRSWLSNLYFIYIEKDHPADLSERIDSLDMTYGEFLDKTHITDIGAVMIFLEKYIGDIHRFIETRQFNRITGIHYERSTSPHNGYYYKHMVEYEKGEIDWDFVEPPRLIGTKKR